jgi:hypothetical protein
MANGFAHGGFHDLPMPSLIELFEDGIGLIERLDGGWDLRGVTEGNQDAHEVMLRFSDGGESFDIIGISAGTVFADLDDSQAMR